MGLIIIFIFLIAMFCWLASVIRGLYDVAPSSRREAFALGYPRASTPIEPVVTPVETEPKWERLPQVNLDFATTVEPQPVIEPATEVLPNFTTPPSKTEESLLFRSLVLGMFVLGVISVDLAAGTHYSAVGIPFALLGNAWSWHRRHHARHWANILVSVGSLAILFGGLVPLLVAQMQVEIDRLTPAIKMSGTIELALGMLLVSLQMGLSFYLYDRRSLGYGIVASGLLMAVAAGLSHDLSLLILLCGFMAIAMPTLMLDYRSRLALPPLGIAPLSPPGARSVALPWRYLSQLAALSLIVGMMLSVFLPNFHLPDLSGSTAELNRLQNLTPKSHLPPPGLPPNSSPPATNTPAPTVREMASKLLGQPGNSNYPDTIKQDNLQLPPELASQLQQATQQMLAASPRSLATDFDRAAYLADYLKQHYQEDPQLANRTDLPPIDSKSIQQFTAACTTAPQTCKLVGTKPDVPVVYTAMLRSIGIPARLKTDDNLAQIDPQTKLYPRPPAKAQSQTEVYFANWGWLSLDSTPDRPLFNADPRQRDRLQQQLQQLGGTDDRPKVAPTSTPSNSPSADKSAPQPLAPAPPAPAPSPATPPELPKWATDPAIVRTIVLIIAIGGAIAWYWWYHRRQQQQLAHLPPIERIYRSMLLSLSKQGRSISPAQTQLEYAQNIGQTEHPQIAKAVWEISQQYTAWRYGKQSIDVRQLTAKLQYLQHLQQLAANRKRQQWFARQQSLWTPKHNLKPRT